MDYKAQVTTAIENLLTSLVTATANPKPNYSVEGQSVSFGEFIRMHVDALKTLFELMQYVDPYELRTNIL